MISTIHLVKDYPFVDTHIYALIIISEKKLYKSLPLNIYWHRDCEGRMLIKKKFNVRYLFPYKYFAGVI